MAGKKSAKRTGRKASVKTKHYDQLSVSEVKIPQGGMVARHVHRRDYVVIPHTEGRVKYTVRQGDKVVSQGTKKLSAGKPLHFSAGAKGRDVELHNVGPAVHFHKIMTASKGKGGS
jgi:quercetin dioxygenase-like cupin family protein